MDMNKPYKGMIENWIKLTWKPEQLLGFPGTLEYSVIGIPINHPEFVGWIKTSAVVKQEGNEIETLNSRYTLGNASNRTSE